MRPGLGNRGEARDAVRLPAEARCQGGHQTRPETSTCPGQPLHGQARPTPQRQHCPLATTWGQMQPRQEPTSLYPGWPKSSPRELRTERAGATHSPAEGLIHPGLGERCLLQTPGSGGSGAGLVLQGAQRPPVPPAQPPALLEASTRLPCPEGPSAPSRPQQGRGEAALAVTPELEPGAAGPALVPPETQVHLPQPGSRPPPVRGGGDTCLRAPRQAGAGGHPWAGVGLTSPAQPSCSAHLCWGSVREYSRGPPAVPARPAPGPRWTGPARAAVAGP